MYQFDSRSPLVSQNTLPYMEMLREQIRTRICIKRAPESKRFSLLAASTGKNTSLPSYKVQCNCIVL